jgi:hypothetical protein
VPSPPSKAAAGVGVDELLLERTQADPPDLVGVLVFAGGEAARMKVWSEPSTRSRAACCQDRSVCEHSLLGPTRALARNQNGPRSPARLHD